MGELWGIRPIRIEIPYQSTLREVELRMTLFRKKEETRESIPQEFLGPNIYKLTSLTNAFLSTFSLLKDPFPAFSELIFESNFKFTISGR